MTDNKKPSFDYLKNLLEKSASGQIETLLRLLDGLHGPNLNIVLNQFIEAVRVLGRRQTYSKRNQLKPKEIRAALELIAFHYEMTQDMDIRKFGVELLGKNLTEKEALDYYEKKVIGTVKDVGGREIIIDEEGMQHLYKESETGDHVVHSDNFQPVRAKRLPWIRWTIENTKEVYFQSVDRPENNPSWHVFGYAQSMLVPFKDANGRDALDRNYFFIIIRRKRKDSPLEFVTAYYFKDHDELFKRISLFSPYKFNVSK